MWPSNLSCFILRKYTKSSFVAVLMMSWFCLVVKNCTHACRVFSNFRIACFLTPCFLCHFHPWKAYCSILLCSCWLNLLLRSGKCPLLTWNYAKLMMKRSSYRWVQHCARFLSLTCFRFLAYESLWTKETRVLFDYCDFPSGNSSMCQYVSFDSG